MCLDSLAAERRLYPLTTRNLTDFQRHDFHDLPQKETFYGLDTLPVRKAFPGLTVTLWNSSFKGRLPAFLSQGPQHGLDPEITCEAFGPDIHVTHRLIKSDPPGEPEIYFFNDAYVKAAWRPTVLTLMIHQMPPLEGTSEVHGSHPA